MTAYTVTTTTTTTTMNINTTTNHFNLTTTTTSTTTTTVLLLPLVPMYFGEASALDAGAQVAHMYGADGMQACACTHRTRIVMHIQIG